MIGPVALVSLILQAPVPLPDPPPAAPLALEDVLQSARRAYPLLVAAMARRDAAAAEALAAEGGFDTTLRSRATAVGLGYYDYATVDTSIEQPTSLWGTSFFGGWRIGRGGTPGYYGFYDTKSGGEFRAGATVPLLRNGSIDRRRASLRQAELGQKVADQDVAVVRIDLERSAAYRYWDWVVAGRRLAIAQDLLSIAQARDEAIRRRSDLGEVASIDRVDNERAIAERRERVVAATRLLEQASIALSLFVRDDEGEPILVAPARLPKQLPEPEPAPATEVEDVERALAQRPELQRFRTQRTQNQIEVDLAGNQLKPALDLTLMGSQDVGRGDPRFDRPELMGTLTFELPVQRRVAKGRKAAAEAGLSRLAAEERMARDRVAAEVRDAVSALRAARERVELVRRQKALALHLEQAERTRFELGESTLLFVNLREQARADASLIEVEAMASWLRAQADYRAALGGYTP